MSASATQGGHNKDTATIPVYNSTHAILNWLTELRFYVPLDTK